MKIKSFFFSFILLFSFGSQAQIQYSYHFASDSSNAIFGSLVLDEFGLAIYNLLKDEKIEFYADSNLTRKRDMSDSRSFFFRPHMQQMINPNNPDDPYDLVDTMVYEYVSPYQWVHLYTGENYLTLVSHPGQNIYIRKKDLKKMDQARLILAVLDAFPTKRIAGDDFGLYVQQFYDGLQWEILSELMYGTIPVYEDISFNLSYTDYMKVDICNKMEYVQTRPANPSPYDIIDSVMITPADSSSPSGLIFLTLTHSNGSSDLKGISINCFDNILWMNEAVLKKTENIKYIRKTGWLKWSDIQKQFSWEKAYFIRLNYVWSLSHLNR
ncbi:MAG: hypothetical protein GC180_06425 [Bacteroidetes bacterium]|nr:hypothetical protein [Bacteroidota bacterium]